MLLKELTKLNSVSEFMGMLKADQIQTMLGIGEYLHRQYNHDKEKFMAVHKIFGTGPTIQRCFEDGMQGLTKAELQDRFLLLIDLFDLTLEK